MEVRSRVSQAQTLAAGAAAWLALNAFVYIAAPLLGLSMGPVASFFGGLLLPASASPAQAWAGRVVLLLAALGWSLLYRVVGPHLPRPAWVRGVLYGAFIWLASVLVLPLIGFRLGRAAALALSALAHGVFGVTLAAISEVQAQRA